MEVTTDIRRRDWVWVTLHMLFRARANGIFFLLLSAVILIVLLLTRPPTSLAGVPPLIGISMVSAGVGLVAGLAFQLLYASIAVGKGDGLLGTHTYALSDRGLHERTVANEGLQLWTGIRSIRSVGDYILIQVNAYQFHIIPGRAFRSRAEFDAFFAKANELRNAALTT